MAVQGDFFGGHYKRFLTPLMLYGHTEFCRTLVQPIFPDSVLAVNYNCSAISLIQIEI
jgi:hypothetical protein